MEQIENPKIISCPNDHLIYDYEGNNTQWRGDNIFDYLCWKIWTAKNKIMQLEHSLVFVQWLSHV